MHRFSKIALPLNKLTKKGVDYKWTPECEEAFRTLRSALTLSPVLILPKTGPTSRFVVSTDSSGFAVSGILLQDQGNGLQSIEYYAKSMNATEVRYPVHEQELFAVVSALRHWRHYLDGCERFLVVTDHDTLKHFMTQKEMSKRQAGWLEVISPFANNMDIFYRRGETNLADGLSRRPDLKLSIKQLQEYEANSDTEYLSLLSTVALQVGIDDKFLDAVRAAYSKDSHYSTCPIGMTLDEHGLYRLDGRLCIPSYRQLKLQLMHHYTMES